MEAASKDQILAQVVCIHSILMLLGKLWIHLIPSLLVIGKAMDQTWFSNHCGHPDWEKDNTDFKTLAKVVGIHFGLMPLRKLWIHLIPSLLVTSKVIDHTWFSNRCRQPDWEKDNTDFKTLAKVVGIHFGLMPLGKLWIHLIPSLPVKNKVMDQTWFSDCSRQPD